MVRIKAARTVALGVAVTAGVVGGSALAVASSSPDQPIAAPAAAAAIAPVNAIDSSVRDSFKLFRSTGGALRATATSGAIEDIQAATRGMESYGLNPALARRIATVTGSGWVVPGKGVLCIAAPDPVDGFGIACDTTSNAAKHGLYVALASGSSGRVTALVPDAATVMRDGTARSADASGIYSADIPADTGLSVKSQAGTTDLPTAFGAELSRPNADTQVDAG